MIYTGNKAEQIKIAYVGGGSRGWAWGLMSDLVSGEDMSGDVYLYDINYEAAQHNEIIGNMFNTCEGARSQWHYHAVKTAEEAMTDADFVIISILPGTFDEMASDVHTPEKYGIYQSVGDTTGPGGIVRAMRAIPMFEEIGKNIKQYCPKAWVINYTNPMTLCVKTLYRVFPEIKAFGCCHEVFGTQDLLVQAVEEEQGLTGVRRSDIKVNPIGVNHFTWLTKASYKNLDLFPIYKRFADKRAATSLVVDETDSSEYNYFRCTHRVKFDLFRRYGCIAAAGDRHLAEFCEGKWYLSAPETVAAWGFALTPVAWRKNSLNNQLRKSEEYRNGTRKPVIYETGEEGTRQMRAILGLCELVTNVNLPNVGQIPNLPLGAVVETNAVFRGDSVTPVMAGPVPASVYPLISRVCGQQEELSAAIADRDVNRIFSVFVNDPLVTCDLAEAKRLFVEMTENTSAYLTSYALSTLM